MNYFLSSFSSYFLATMTFSSYYSVNIIEMINYDNKDKKNKKSSNPFRGFTFSQSHYFFLFTSGGLIFTAANFSLILLNNTILSINFNFTKRSAYSSLISNTETKAECFSFKSIITSWNTRININSNSGLNPTWFNIG